ncbi:hypothetical protein AcdelDRAFT_1988 [Acidovorax delafieldii 2AN]|uniref:Uncharacterized protein n=1 Tax=Acidovorax delafieldii 2AN TaxID=573060 RepID=C5T508_ACIDE|nr:hypothetical protein [Acidovorax delafieldii]EER60463.1 hypothetical protein AcdelDRAFT_1988 [Acidovorax delafieldii 2AN]
MNYACTLIAVVIGLGMAAVAAHESDPAAEPTELQQAQHSRDFAAREVCQGQAFEWTDDKTLVCFKEQP